MPSVITSPQSPGRIGTFQETSRVSKPTPIPFLALGENLNVLVLSNSIGHKAFKFYRSNPVALKEMIASVKDFLINDNIKDFSKYFSKEDTQNLIKVLDKIIISKKNMTNPLFLRDSFLALGLASERRLMKSLSDPEILNDEKNNPTLKGILLKLSSKLTPIHLANDYTKGDSQKMMQFSDFADHAATVIESLQIVNILTQERDGFFVLQIPFQFQDGIRMQDLYIESDRNRKEDESKKECRLVLFLDMDTLGELAVDAGIQDRVIRCTFRCSDPHVLVFMQTLLPELRKALSGIDYAIGSLRCVLDRNIESWKNDFLRKCSLFSESVIDVCV